MTPSQSEAKRIVEMFYNKIEDATAGMFEEDVPYVEARKEAAKQCALLHVDGVIAELKMWGAPYLFEDAQSNDWGRDRLNHWLSIHQAIEEL